MKEQNLGHQLSHGWYFDYSIRPQARTKVINPMAYGTPIEQFLMTMKISLCSQASTSNRNTASKISCCDINNIVTVPKPIYIIFLVRPNYSHKPVTPGLYHLGYTYVHSVYMDSANISVTELSWDNFIKHNGINPLQWRQNERDGFSNHQPHDYLLNLSFRRRSKKTSKLRVTGLCVGNSPVTGEFPAQRPATRKMLPFDDVIMQNLLLLKSSLNLWYKLSVIA